MRRAHIHCRDRYQESLASGGNVNNEEKSKDSVTLDELLAPGKHLVFPYRVNEVQVRLSDDLKQRRVQYPPSQAGYAVTRAVGEHITRGNVTKRGKFFAFQNSKGAPFADGGYINPMTSVFISEKQSVQARESLVFFDQGTQMPTGQKAGSPEQEFAKLKMNNARRRKEVLLYITDTIADPGADQAADDLPIVIVDAKRIPCVYGLSLSLARLHRLFVS